MKQIFKAENVVGALAMALALIVSFYGARGSRLNAAQAPSQGSADQGAGRGGRGAQTPEQAALQAARVGNSTTMDLEGSTLGRRHFEPGNRTYWHSHAGGFLMLVEKGHGRVQHRGQPMRELGPGDVDYTPPGVEHWHGAAPNDEMVQLAVVVGGGGIQFKDPVTDAEYEGKAK